MNPSYPRLLPLGDAAWTLEFGQQISPSLHGRVMGLATRLQAWLNQGRAVGEAQAHAVHDVVPTFRSLTVHFDPLRADAQVLGQTLLTLAKASNDAPCAGRHWRLPVCFAPTFAPDLPGLAQACGMSPEAVVARLTGARYRVYLIGFMPGFPYLGGLPPALAQPRLATPRKAVPARSLAVAGEMCCVYPWESPGGWHLLGHVPLPLFELQREAEPAWLAAGDEVTWDAVSPQRCEALARDWAAGRLDRAQFLATTAAPCAGGPG